MSKIYPARMTAEIEWDFVVFLIGMCFNHFWKMWKLRPGFFAMPRMLGELAKHPELGLLRAR
jgi:hypothetical protein